MGTALSTPGNKRHTPCLIGVATSPLNPNAPRVALSQFSPRLYIGSRFLWYSFILLVRRVSDGVTGSVCDHVGYNSGTVLVYSYALTGPAAL